MFMAARVIGPAIAGLVIAGFGVSWCFFANGVFVFGGRHRVLGHAAETSFFSVEPVPKRKGQLREGLAVRHGSTPALRLVLVLTAVIGTLAFNFQVVLPLLAKQTFSGGADTLGVLYASMSIGSVVGRARQRPRGAGDPPVRARRCPRLRRRPWSRRRWPPTFGLELLVLVPVGAAGIAFHRHGQRRPPDRDRSRDARTGGGAVHGGVPRQHAYRRSRHRSGVTAARGRVPGLWVGGVATPRRHRCGHRRHPAPSRGPAPGGGVTDPRVTRARTERRTGRLE